MQAVKAIKHLLLKSRFVRGGLFTTSVATGSYIWGNQDGVNGVDVKKYLPSYLRMKYNMPYWPQPQEQAQQPQVQLQEAQVEEADNSPLKLSSQHPATYDIHQERILAELQGDKGMVQVDLDDITVTLDGSGRYQEREIDSVSMAELQKQKQHLVDKRIRQASGGKWQTIDEARAGLQRTWELGKGKAISWGPFYCRRSMQELTTQVKSQVNEEALAKAIEATRSSSPKR